MTRIAVALLVLGFGTKAGLVPLHAWLPDAHSQAPAPVSALMSGVLLSVAFYAILRVKVIADAALGPASPAPCCSCSRWPPSLVAAALLIGAARLQADAGLLQHRAHGPDRPRRRRRQPARDRRRAAAHARPRPGQGASLFLGAGQHPAPTGTSRDRGRPRPGRPRTGAGRLLRRSACSPCSASRRSACSPANWASPAPARRRPRLGHRRGLRCSSWSSPPPSSATPAGCCSAPPPTPPRPTAPDPTDLVVAPRRAARTVAPLRRPHGVCGHQSPHRPWTICCTAAAVLSEHHDRPTSPPTPTAADRDRRDHPPPQAKSTGHTASRARSPPPTCPPAPPHCSATATGSRWSPPTTTRDRTRALRVVYLFTAARPDRRVELHVPLDRDRPARPEPGRPVVSRRPVRTRNARPVRHRTRRPPTAPPAGPPPALAARLAPDAPRRRTRRHRSATDEPFPFLTVEGPGVYEIPVGPVHAGLIEPGHFRFSVVGETILKLKARLWYVHKGIEKLFEGRAPHDGLALAERISGDTAVGHTLAYCRAVEDALDTVIRDEAQRIRGILLELERLYNHIADIGALCNDVGYGILNAHAQRIRETLLRLNDHPPATGCCAAASSPAAPRLHQLPDPTELHAIAADIARDRRPRPGPQLVAERFTGTAVLTAEQATDIGTLGYVARASGIDTDARRDHPIRLDLGHTPAPCPPAPSGDVLARFQQRAEEIPRPPRSITAWPSCSTDSTAARPGRAAPRRPPTERGGAAASGVGIVEGWRGTIVHRVEIGPDGTADPGQDRRPVFFNWPALPVALTDTIVPDFPLANKSFNLSYAGNDL